MATQSISVTEFKAKCLSLLNQVQSDGKEITLTRRGVPVAVVGPAKRKPRKSLKGSWAGKIRIIGDIVNTPDITALWEISKIEEEVKREAEAVARHARSRAVDSYPKAPVTRAASMAQSRRAVK